MIKNERELLIHDKKTKTKKKPSLASHPCTCNMFKYLMFQTTKGLPKLGAKELLYAGSP